MRSRVYSYIRFSSSEQAGGDSLRRQTEAARRFAAANGMELDESLTMQDLGRSAYAGHHVTEGALGEFLAACEADLVPKGSVLVVEAVDRLTRLDHLDAVTLLGRLLKYADLHVVQLNRTFTNEIVRHDMGAIFTLIGAITLGHQESQQKSHRVGSAWEQKRKAAKDHGTKLTAKAPAWLKSIEEGFEPIPERVAIVLDMFERFARGESQFSITGSMNAANVPVWGRGARWNRSYITKILTNEAVVGVLKMGRKRKADASRTIVESVPDYYPKIIDPELFAEANRRIKSGTLGRSPTRNPLQGVLRCPHCGGIVIRQWKGDKSRPKLVCGAVQDGAGKPGCKTVRVDLEKYWATERPKLLKIAEAAAAAFHPMPVNSLRKDAEDRRGELAAVRESMNKLVRPSAFLVGQVAKLESEIQTLEEEIRTVSREAGLGWDNLRAALADESTEPAEISARLKVVFASGIVLETSP
jgi:DNA invertase Pin-like site-specific DNA recombinase